MKDDYKLKEQDYNFKYAYSNVYLSLLFLINDFMLYFSRLKLQNLHFYIFQKSAINPYTTSLFGLLS